MRTLTLALLVAAPLLVGAAPAQPTAPRPRAAMHPGCRPLPPEAPVRLTFRDAPVADALQFFACVTGVVFVTGEEIDGVRIALTAPGAVRLDVAWGALREALAEVGLFLREEGPRLRVARLDA